MRYAIWNNKGGVGKTFLTFMIACEYAIKHPEKNVVILDLCPQANVSEIVLGGNGKGASKLSELLNDPQKRKTIGGYFDARIKQPHSMLGSETSFLLSNLTTYNPNLPSNLHLIAGDPSLEIQAQAINQLSAVSLPTDSWANIHRWLIDLINGIKTQYTNAVFFIDCNPSFAAYTELAILASDRLIVPCTADGSSARAIENIGRLVYGVNLPSEYKKVNFSFRAKESKFSLPSIHIIASNRSTQYARGASHAFEAMFGEIKKRADQLEKDGVHFSTVKENRFEDIPDSHSVSVVCSYEGVPLSRLKLGQHQVHELVVQVNSEPYERYKESIDRLISHL